jgi:phage-related protein
MVSKPKKVQARFFETASGMKPVREWLTGLSRDDRLAIGKDIQRVEFGWPIGMPYCRSLGRGLWEVRTNLNGGRIVRVIFAFLGGDIVLLHGFEKKSQKTPDREIEVAIKRLRELE